MLGAESASRCCVSHCRRVGRWWCPVLPRKIPIVAVVGEPMPVKKVAKEDRAAFDAAVDAAHAEIICRLVEQEKRRVPPSLRARMRAISFRSYYFEASASLCATVGYSTATRLPTPPQMRSSRSFDHLRDCQKFSNSAIAMPRNARASEFL